MKVLNLFVLSLVFLFSLTVNDCLAQNNYIILAPSGKSSDLSDLIDFISNTDNNYEIRNIDYFQMYASVLNNEPQKYPLDKMKQTDKLISLETGVVKEWTCNMPAAQNINRLKRLIGEIENSGCKVRLLMMDEPLLGGVDKCKFTYQEPAEKVKMIVAGLKKGYPDLEIGDIIPYPHYSVGEIKEWVWSLNRKGVDLTLVSLDINMAAVKQWKGYGAERLKRDLRSIERIISSAGFSMGIIIGSCTGGQAKNSEEFYRGAIELCQVARSSFTRFPKYIFIQSWSKRGIPYNLSRNSEFSLIDLVNDVYRRIR